MAYAAANLKKIAGGGDHNLFLYKSTDALSVIIASGYFSTSTADLKKFDVIIAIGTSGGTATVDVIYVSSATAAATVTTVNGT
jgi:NAD-dependent SIR2 family protein deacetylase